ncbi:hypothetical protein [Acidovorax sp.]|uniref:hypothetical protein n=1 Tax=Acidovorax sp. TaxID=1872122 RepID=UPI00391F601A
MQRPSASPGSVHSPVARTDAGLVIWIAQSGVVHQTDPFRAVNLIDNGDFLFFVVNLDDNPNATLSMADKIFHPLFHAHFSHSLD